MTHEIKAQNIKCNGCATSITKGLLEVAGVEEVTVNIEKGAVTVTGNASKESISEKLTVLGYPEKK